MGMIAKSIAERKILAAQAFNTNVEFKYLKSCPDNIRDKVKNRIKEHTLEYLRLRGAFDDYQDPKTLANDEKVKNIIKKLGGTI